MHFVSPAPISHIGAHATNKHKIKTITEAEANNNNNGNCNKRKVAARTTGGEGHFNALFN